MAKQTLELLKNSFRIHSFSPDKTIPEQVLASDVYFIAKTQDELSIVCTENIKLDSIESEGGWEALEVLGPLGFSLTGILSDISGVLAAGKISIFAISTFDTDYILVKRDKMQQAIQLLEKSQYKIIQHSI